MTLALLASNPAKSKPDIGSSYGRRLTFAPGLGARWETQCVESSLAVSTE